MYKFFMFAVLACTFTGCKAYEPVNGDIIFQTSLSSQSKAIQIATKSPYSHMGIVYVKDNKAYVFEAARKVKLTPLDEWVRRGKNGKFVVKRVRNYKKILTRDVQNKMQIYGRKFEGKAYDLYFGWSDERIYCSELVWKIYESTTCLQIGTLQRLKDFDLSAPEVRKKLKERYGSNIPENETVISPQSMYSSELLETVYKN